MNIVKTGKSFLFFNDAEIIDKLEVGNYILNWDAKGNTFIDQTVPFKLDPNTYDFESKLRKQAMRSYIKGDKNVGVLLEGYKGQGKSIAAKKMCIESNLPVIMINRQIPKEVNFIAQIMDIKQQCIIFIDEFEKIFQIPKNDDDGKFHNQNSFLSLMDGAFSSSVKKLFILTTNDEISSHFINRPSRIRYYKKYNYITQDIFDTIINDKLINKDFEDDLRSNLPLIDCSIDLITTIVDEINTHNIPYSEFKEFFNHKPRKISYSRSIMLSDGNFIYKDTIEVDREISRGTMYIDNRRAEIKSLSGNGDIIYKGNMYYDDLTDIMVHDSALKQYFSGKDGKDKTKDVIMKLTRIGINVINNSQNK